MEPAFFSLVFLLLLLPVSAVVPFSEDYFTRHDDLRSVAHVVFDDNKNVLINDFGEPELYFDSAHSSGVVYFQSSVGNEKILLKNPRVVKIDASGAIQNMPKGIDGLYALQAFWSGTLESNSVIFLYNPLTAECGGNYALVVDILNLVFPDDAREVKLRLHLPCKSDMVIVLSPQMGKPTREFTDALFRYVADTGTDYGNTIKVTTLKPSAFSVNPKALEIDKEVSFSSGGGDRPLMGSLLVSLAHNLQRTTSGGFQYTPNFEISDLVHSQIISTNEPGSWSGVAQSPQLNLQAKIKTASFMDVKWFEVILTLNDQPSVTKYFFPTLCENDFYITGVEVFSLESVSGFFENCADAESAISRALVTNVPFTAQNWSIDAVSKGSITMINNANVRIYGTSKTPESLEIAKNNEVVAKVKNQLARLAKVYSPDYFMLVGSTKDIPMPSVAYSNMFSSDGLNPSDVLYFYSQGDAKVDVEVARIPVALDEPDPWGFAAEVLQNALVARARNIKNILMVSDACGGKGNCFIAEATRTAAANYWRSCTNNPDCLLSPPYCKLTEGSACRGVSEIATKLASADFIHVNAKSNAEHFYYVDSRDNSELVFGASDVLPAGNNGFIASTTASYAGSIDSHANYGELRKDDSLTFSLLNAGAGLVIANPRMGIIQRVPLPLLEFEHVILKALKDEDQRPIGEIINQRRNALLAHSGNELFIFSALHSETYGDPLMRVYKQS